MGRKTMPAMRRHRAGPLLDQVVQELDRYMAEQRRLFAHLLADQPAQREAEASTPPRVT